MNKNFRKFLSSLPALAYLVALASLQCGLVLSESAAIRGFGEANYFSAPSASLLWHTNPEVVANVQFARASEPSAKYLSKFWLAAILGESVPKTSAFQDFSDRSVVFPARLRQHELLFPFHSFL